MLDVEALVAGHLQSCFHGRNLVLRYSEHLEAVRETDDLLLSLLDLVNLGAHKSFLLGNLPHDILLQQVDSLSLIVRDLLKQVGEASDVLWRLDLDVVDGTLHHEVLQRALALLNHSNLLSEG